MASISYLHVIFQIPFDMGRMQLLEKCLKGLKGEKLRDQRPITVKELEFADPVDNVMLWAAFTLAFFGFLRCSEFTSNSWLDATYHLSQIDIIFHPNILNAESYNVVIKRSKTDPFRHGCRLTIGSSLNKLVLVPCTGYDNLSPPVTIRNKYYTLCLNSNLATRLPELH